MNKGPATPCSFTPVKADLKIEQDPRAAPEMP